MVGEWLRCSRGLRPATANACGHRRDKVRGRSQGQNEEVMEKPSEKGLEGSEGCGNGSLKGFGCVLQTPSARFPLNGVPCAGAKHWIGNFHKCGSLAWEPQHCQERYSPILMALAGRIQPHSHGIASRRDTAPFPWHCQEGYSPIPMALPGGMHSYSHSITRRDTAPFPHHYQEGYSPIPHSAARNTNLFSTEGDSSSFPHH